MIPEMITGKPVMSVNFKGEVQEVICGIKYPDSVEDIGTFMLDSNIQYVICGAVLKKIQEKCFFGCTNLKEVQLSEGLECIEAGAFFDCPKLGDLYIPESVTEFGDYPGAGHGFDESCTIHVIPGSAGESFCMEHEQDDAFPKWTTE